MPQSLTDELIFSPPSLGTVLYLPGLPGEGSTIYDRSPYGNHGTITGATWKYHGVPYLDFDGTDDKVDFGAKTVHRINVQAVLKCWFKISDTTVAGHMLMSKEGPTLATDTEYMFYLYDTDSDDNYHLQFNISDTGNGSVNATRQFLNISNVVSDTNWHHYCAVMDESLATTDKVKTFVDGVYIDTITRGTLTGAWLTSVYQGNSDFRLGESERLTGVGWSAKGSMASELLMKDTTWTIVQVQANYLQEKGLFA